MKTYLILSYDDEVYFYNCENIKTALLYHIEYCNGKVSDYLNEAILKMENLNNIINLVNDYEFNCLKSEKIKFIIETNLTEENILYSYLDYNFFKNRVRDPIKAKIEEKEIDE